jgi:hypothetical protein
VAVAGVGNRIGRVPYGFGEGVRLLKPSELFTKIPGLHGRAAYSRCKTTVFTCVLLWGLYDALTRTHAAWPQLFGSDHAARGLFGRFASVPQTPQRGRKSQQLAGAERHEMINSTATSARTLFFSGKTAAQGCGFAAVALLAAGMAQPAAALVINPIFDGSITSLANAGTIEAAFNTVAHDFASQFTSTAQINVNVSWGSVGGQPLASNAVAASTQWIYGYYTYSQVKSWLTNASLSNPSNTALAMAVANLPATDPAGVSKYVIPSSEAKVLGVISPTKASSDGSIGFGVSTSGYDFNPADGIAIGTYDFQAVAAHELDEVLGRISGLYNTAPTYRTVFDLFRYTSPGVLSFSYYDAAYFSIDGGRTNLGNFNNLSSGDRGDWLTSSMPTDIQDASIGRGQRKNLTAVDLTGLDVLGYGGSNLGDTAWNSPQLIAFRLIEPVPEPGSLVLLASMLGLLGAAGLRRRLPR